MEETESVIELVARYLAEDEMSFSIREDAPVIDTGCVGDSGRYRIAILTRDEPISTLDVIVLNPTFIPEQQRVLAAEAVVRANHGLLIGHFDLDMSDGELVFRASLPIIDGTVTQEQFGYVLWACCWSVDRFT